MKISKLRIAITFFWCCMYKIISCSVKWMLSAFLLQCIQFTRGVEGVMLS